VTVRIGPHTFDHVVYDADGDVLYLSRGEPRPVADYDATPEGHAVRYGPDGEVVGLTLVNVRWILEREGRVRITMPTAVEADADSLRAALVA
jgi:uncharacterized protein YuzE